MISFFVVVGVALLIVLTVWAIRKGSQEFEKERKDLFEQFAKSRGGQYFEKDILRLQRKIGTMAGFGIASIPIKNIVYMETDKGDLYLFDQMKIVGRNAASQRRVFTACLLEPERSLGVKLVINEAVNAVNANVTRDMGSIVPGTGFIEVGDKVFDDRFVVNSYQPEEAKEFFSDDVKKFLLNSKSRLAVQFGIQIQDKVLAVHNSASSTRNIDKESELQALVDIAQGVLAASSNAA